MTHSIDILASKIVHRSGDYSGSSRKRPAYTSPRDRPGDRISDAFVVSQNGNYSVHVQGAGAYGRRGSSEERIIPVDTERGRGTPEIIDMHHLGPSPTDIKRTVQVEVYTTDQRT
jgi:hypothetical protein